MRVTYKIRLCALTIAVFVLGATCHERVIEDKGSAFAAEAGQATMVLGGCERPLRVGHDACLYEKGKPLPTLRIVFLNPAEYFVSDCNFGILAQGAVDGPSTVEVNVDSLKADIEKQGLCILEIHAKEYFSDPGDPSQKRMIPFIGGWFIRAVEPGFFPTPPKAAINWCYKIQRTTKGRTIMEKCS